MRYRVTGYFDEEVGPDTPTYPEEIQAESKEEAERRWKSRPANDSEPTRARQWDYIEVELMPVEWDHPLSLLDDPIQWIAWQREVGAEEANRLMTEAARRHMEKHGTRSILEVVEKMTSMTARLEEFVDQA